MSNKTTFLNLDKLRTERTVILNGKERALRTMTVKQFMESFDAEKQYKDADEKKRFEILVAEIPKFMSDTTTEELGDLELVQLNALFAFIRGTDSQPQAANIVEDEAGNVEAPAEPAKQ